MVPLGFLARYRPAARVFLEYRALFFEGHLPQKFGLRTISPAMKCLAGIDRGVLGSIIKKNFMSTGIKIVGGSGNTLSWNLTIGHDEGISLEDSSDNILTGNIVISKDTLEIFGQGFADVAGAVQKSQDIEALAALASVVREPQTAPLGWSTLFQKFGTKIGSFSASALEGILSAAAWDALKLILKQLGINL